MSDATLLADLISAGTPAELVARVAAALAIVRDSPGHVRDIVRAYETSRKKTWRETSTKSGGKQTMSASIKKAEGEESVPDSASERCDLTSLSSSIAKPLTEKKESKSARARGTRMRPTEPLSESDWQFARDQGHHDTAIKQMWLEFVDYWIGVPGQRGTKLDWSATWRNRVRQLSSGKKGHVNGSRNATMAALDDLIDRAGSATVGGDAEMVDVTPGRTQGH